jgi:hypothetical protein
VTKKKKRSERRSRLWITFILIACLILTFLLQPASPTEVTDGSDDATNCAFIRGAPTYSTNAGARKVYTMPSGDVYYITYGDPEGGISHTIKGSKQTFHEDVPDDRLMILEGHPENKTSNSQILGPIYITRCMDTLYVDDSNWDGIATGRFMSGGEFPPGT